MSAGGEVRVRLSVDGKLLGRRGQAERIRKLFEDGQLKRVHVTFVPCIVGGAKTPTLLGVPAQALLETSVPLRLERMRQRGARCESVYVVKGRGKFASAAAPSPLGRKPCKRAIRKTNSSAA